MILAGVAAVTVADTAAVSLRDLSAQFYLDEADVGRNRAEACAPKLHELNPAVAVAAHTAPLTEAFLKNFEARPPSRLLLCPSCASPPPAPHASHPACHQRRHCAQRARFTTAARFTRLRRGG